MMKKKKNYPPSDSGPPELVALFKKLREIRSAIENEDSSPENSAVESDW
ncbi:hypothetical protein LLB_2499 [Legionella longbeachae D-4968]|nr:hypothetical protein LLB_2499 [Legionella longbeachae D-4968]